MEARSRLVRKVLDALFAWQRALVRDADPSRTAEERLVALLAVVETEATLDRLTDGWLTCWREVAR